MQMCVQLTGQQRSRTKRRTDTTHLCESLCSIQHSVDTLNVKSCHHDLTLCYTSLIQCHLEFRFKE